MAVVRPEFAFCAVGCEALLKVLCTFDRRGTVFIILLVVGILVLAVSDEDFFFELFVTVPVAVVFLDQAVASSLFDRPERRTSDYVFPKGLVLVKIRIEEAVISEKASFVDTGMSGRTTTRYQPFRLRPIGCNFSPIPSA